VKYDVVVVGAGPAGLTLAKTVAQLGGDVLVLEEHAEVGVPPHCTGKLSVTAVAELGLGETGALHRVRGAVFYPPSLIPLTITRADDQALIFDRTILDQALAADAVDAGATLYTHSRAKTFAITPEGVILHFERQGTLCDVTCRLIVGADGAASHTARVAGLYSKPPSAVRIGVQREVSAVSLIPGLVDLYFGASWAPGFFAWIVPTGRDTARVGLAIQPTAPLPAATYLDAFMTHHPVARQKLGGYRVLAQHTHILPTGGVLPRTVADGVVIVGDAAGQVKSTTGGGLYYGMACAKLAGAAISQALQASSDPLLRRDGLMSYEAAWRARFGREIAFSVRARAFLDALSDGEVDFLFTLLRRDVSLTQQIAVDGDIDRQSRVGRTLLRHVTAVVKRPRLLFKLRKFFALPSV
jgi:digeranylgeranylglycerophospholipid reductase